MQCVVSMAISLAFLLLHAYVWPYPHAGANILKLVTEIQVRQHYLRPSKQSDLTYAHDAGLHGDECDDDLPYPE